MNYGKKSYLPWILNQSSEEVGPRNVVHGILFGCNGPSNLCYKSYLPWILHQTSEEVGPRNVVHGILFGRNGPSNYLSIHMVR